VAPRARRRVRRSHRAASRVASGSMPPTRFPFAWRREMDRATGRPTPWGTLSALLDAVREIEPTLRAHAAEAESRRRLSDAAAGAMRDAGLYRIWIPAVFGGLEVDPVSALRVFEEVSRIDSAAVWNLQISAAISLFAAFLDEQAGAEIFADANVIVAGASSPRVAAASG